MIEVRISELEGKIKRIYKICTTQRIIACKNKLSDPHKPVGQK
jgi:hypothetical protein